jgi:hypothetical protein
MIEALLIIAAVWLFRGPIWLAIAWLFGHLVKFLMWMKGY